MLILAVSSPFLSDLFSFGEHALASLADPAQAGPLRITTPVDAAVVGDGNLVLIEGTAIDRTDGVVDRIEVATDTDDKWTPVDRASDDATQWRYLWSDPTPGFHRLRVRAFGIENQPVVEQSIIVKVDDVWKTPFIVDNPYATAGSYHKGQVHTHSTNSFDGWKSLPPSNLALEYKRRGYDFVAVTDHDVVSQVSGVQDDSFAVIPAYESTSESGHITGMFVDRVVSASRTPQERIDDITSDGGLAILNHPGWRVGWTGTDFRTLHGCFAFEVYNGVTDPLAQRSAGNVQLWHDVLNAKGRPSRIWAVAMDDAHDPESLDRGWVMLKTSRLNAEGIRQSLESGAFYASNGPSFRVLGVLRDAITASSPEAQLIRFIDQDNRVVAEGPAAWAGYKPTGAERWIRVEAIMEDGRTAWSQPFWLLPNAPKAAFVSTWTGMSLVGQTLPGARVHISDRGEYLGSAVANDDGVFTFARRSFNGGSHDFWLMTTARWPDQLTSPPALLAAGEEGQSP
jgi:hypothetical protein